MQFSQSRGIGVLLHPTALPDAPVCGGFGAEARQWLHALARQGIGVWQVLPLAPTDGTGSPYSSPSSFAINPWLLSAQDLVVRYPILLQSMDCEYEEKIMKDLARTFPMHPLFAERGGVGQQKMFNVLKAYAVHDPSLGYCQVR